ncbi:MAG: Asp-tRNA(Asn)/Glu-tRNA(Gln) amidotransferase subunit GatC [Candidatus Hydrogenedentota bacterium]
MVSLDEVKRIASLARLAVTDEEAEQFAAELSKILGFAASIRELDTTNVPSTTHVLDIVDVWREDEPGKCVDRDTALAQAPAAEEGCFIAPKIV